MKHILKCLSCGKYTLNEKCSCGGNAVTPKPAKYNPDDKYARYRREAKMPEIKKRGLI
ncbi:MAG: nucleolar RNA-binding Nop10p family protein [Candidatus Nanoarchaeia archaeon]|nr:nucleolar RNA-binding Nop10p family protein [Candidatus Nanoarchaeia archaeon]